MCILVRVDAADQMVPAEAEEVGPHSTFRVQERPVKIIEPIGAGFAVGRDHQKGDEILVAVFGGRDDDAGTQRPTTKEGRWYYWDIALRR
jgi:hypothetical protein